MATEAEIKAYFESSKGKIQESLRDLIPDHLKNEPFKMQFQLTHPSGATLHFGLCPCKDANGVFGLHDCRDCVPPQ
jgi:hypothetical protein